MKTMFGKRQVLIATLVVALGLAIYLNFQFNKAGEDFTATGALSSSSSESHNYGDAAYVNARRGTPAQQKEATLPPPRPREAPTLWKPGSIGNSPGKRRWMC